MDCVICGKSCITQSPHSCGSCSSCCSENCDSECNSPRRENPHKYCTIKALITPLNNIVTPNSNNAPLIEFSFKRINGIVQFQWESFSGTLGESGINILMVQQQFSRLPVQEEQYPIRVIYNSVPQIGYLIVRPNSPQSIFFALNNSDNGSGNVIGDTIAIPGSCVTWIYTSQKCKSPKGTALALISPLNNVTTPNSTNAPEVQFTFRRLNGIVDFQWETFSGSLGESGVNFLTVQKQFSGLPSQEEQYLIRIIYKSIPQIGYLIVRPGSPQSILFSLSNTDNGSGNLLGDNILIPAGCVSWISST